MRWLVFVIFAYVLHAAEVGLAPLLYFNSPAGILLPSFTLALGVYVALWANANAAHWALFSLGLLADLRPVGYPDAESLGSLAQTSQTIILGPHALGFLFASYVVLKFRNNLNRESTLSLPAMVLVGGLFAYLARTAVLALRAWPLMQPLDNWSASNQMMSQFLNLLYTTLTAFPLGYLLSKSHPLWAFESTRGYNRRG